MDTGIKVGDEVRSHDFWGRKDCYVEGEVMELITSLGGYPMYRIRVTKKVMEDEEVGIQWPEVFPPANGTPQAMSGDPANYVELIRAATTHHALG